MRVIIEKNYDELSRWAADHVVETINKLATNSRASIRTWFPNWFIPNGYVCSARRGCQGRQGFIQARHYFQHG